MATEEDLKAGSLVFEQRHNSSYRYSKLGGKTPLKALAASNAKLRFPAKDEAPMHRIKKPEIGRYHVVRIIRSDLKLNIFGECFSAPPERNLITNCVKKQVSVHDVMALNNYSFTMRVTICATWGGSR